MLAALAAVVAAVPPVAAPAGIDDVLADTVPAGALVVCAPLALPPEVLTKICFSISGLCQ